MARGFWMLLGMVWALLMSGVFWASVVIIVWSFL